MNRSGNPVSVTRPPSSTGLFKRLRMGRKNLLSVWSDDEYRNELFDFKIMNQQYVVCNSPDTVRKVFLEEHDNYDRKSPQMRHALEPLLGDGLFASDGEVWKERRKYGAPAFENELLPGYFETMVFSANELVEQWKSRLQSNAHSNAYSNEVDMLNEMARLTARIIGRRIFGDSTSDEEATQVVQGFTDYQHHVEQLDLADSLGLPFLRLFRNSIRTYKTNLSAEAVHKVIDEIIERSSALDEEKFSLISIFLTGKTGTSAKDHACPLGETAARNEAIVMFMAGHETTANSLAWCWYLLDKYPEAMKKVHKEVDDVLKGNLPTLEDIEKLQYTRAVFEEAMRLYPPVPLLSRQARHASKIKGIAVEADAIILVVPWLLHRHDKYWQNPDAFQPERFLPGAQKPDKFVYIPFSVGHRVCLGKRFGLVEGITCLAIIAQAFTPKLKDEHEVDIECRLTLHPQDGLPMSLIARSFNAVID